MTAYAYGHYINPSKNSKYKSCLQMKTDII